MTTRFDPDAGLLRVRHGALAVLALLASDPTSARLHDHGVAPLLAELRGAGMLDATGMHPGVAPIAAAIAEATTVADLGATDHGVHRDARVWRAPTLAVVGVRDAEDPHTYELMADRPERLPALVAELVGLSSTVPAPVDGSRSIPLASYGALVAADSRVLATDVTAALGVPSDEAWSVALYEALVGSVVRWRLRARRVGTDETLGDLEVLDAGAAGTWLGIRDDDAITLTPTSREEVVARLTDLVEASA